MDMVDMTSSVHPIFSTAPDEGTDVKVGILLIHHPLCDSLNACANFALRG